MLIFVKLLCGQKIELPVRFKVYGLDDGVPGNEAVFFSAEIGKISSRERMVSVCLKEETNFLDATDCLCARACMHVCVYPWPIEEASTTCQKFSPSTICTLGMNQAWQQVPSLAEPFQRSPV